MDLFYIGHREKQYLNKYGACGSREKGSGAERRVVENIQLNKKQLKKILATQKIMGELSKVIIINEYLKYGTMLNYVAE